MFKFIKSLFEKKLELSKTIYDSKFGKLTTDYVESDEYFNWDFEVKNKTENATSVTIDGTLEGPFSEVLSKAYLIMDTLELITQSVQKELNLKFQEKNIDLGKYYIDDIYFFKDEESNSICYDIEYFSDVEEMISVEFQNDKIILIEFY